MDLITGFSHVTLSVSNLDDSFLFYQDMLGLKPVMRSAISAYFEIGKDWLALVEDANTRSEPPREYTHLAFHIPSDQFQSFTDALLQNQVTQWQEGSSESFYFLDPDGHKLEIHAATLQDRLISRKAAQQTTTVFFEHN